MSSDTSANPVRMFLDSAGVAFAFINPVLPTTTVPEAAIALGCSIDEVVKTLLFTDGSDQWVIAIATGLDRVDKRALARAIGLVNARMASPDMVQERLGFSAGTVPPVAHPSNIPVVVDERSAQLGTVFAGAGTTESMLQIEMADIIRLNQAILAPIIESGGSGVAG